MTPPHRRNYGRPHTTTFAGRRALRGRAAASMELRQLQHCHAGGSLAPPSFSTLGTIYPRCRFRGRGATPVASLPRGRKPHLHPQEKEPYDLRLRL
ncbi:hypothetical protein PR202_gb11675 [Eleusine coracana subsp. coracana]|uniref:Uncharacterized protein n=1 Tax=Eleusine coracana subsp. coracana TaxID=191504 RepID=A0AAV5EMH5_ELECO|nr:hypothetical protein PR202_gb11675 [Eleusine coracana subsp. coracana]